MDVRDLILVGQVSSVDPENCRARVAFDTLDGMVSYDLPVLQPRTVNAQHYSLPEPGEHVFCIFLPTGIEEGFIVGSYYTGGNKPPKSDDGIYYTKYSDGTLIEYDMNTATLTVDAAENITIRGLNISIMGNVFINGHLSVQGNISNTGSMQTCGVHTDGIGGHY